MDETQDLPEAGEDGGVPAPAPGPAAPEETGAAEPDRGGDEALPPADGEEVVVGPPTEADEAALADLEAEAAAAAEAQEGPAAPAPDPDEPPPPPLERSALVEALLFVSKEPLEPARLMEFLEIQEITEFEQLLAETEKRLRRDPQRGLLLKRAAGGLQLVTKPDLHEQLKDFFTVRHTAKLTLASLETLAIVAYRQPVTLAEISDMRGVNSAGPIKNLLQKKLLRIAGRKKVPGLPALYATTPEFLVYFGLDDLGELPTLEELTELFEEKEQPSLFKK